MDPRRARARGLRLAILGLALAPASSRGAEPRSAHHTVTSKGAIVEASVEVNVAAFPTHGLSFFAIDARFAGGGAAHGGIQYSADRRRANWGGLAGAGYATSTPTEVKAFVEVLQNAPGRTRDLAWASQRWYRMRIARGPLETLPAGDYAALDEPPTTIDHARTMRRWDFSIRDLASEQVVFSQVLHTQGETITSWGYWTETGYGVTCSDNLEIQWRYPKYLAESATQAALPLRIARSVDQSDCPVSQTTHIGVDAPRRLGTIQRYGVARPPWAEHGTLLYDDGVPVCAAGQPAAGCGDRGPPSVVISTPGEGARVEPTFGVTASAADDLLIRRVELLVDGQRQGAASNLPYDTQSPYRFTVGPLAAGRAVTLSMRAYDMAGTFGEARRAVVVAGTAPDGASPADGAASQPPGAATDTPVTGGCACTALVGGHAAPALAWELSALSLLGLRRLRRAARRPASKSTSELRPGSRSLRSAREQPPHPPAGPAALVDPSRSAPSRCDPSRAAPSSTGASLTGPSLGEPSAVSPPSRSLASALGTPPPSAAGGAGAYTNSVRTARWSLK